MPEWLEKIRIQFQTSLGGGENGQCDIGVADGLGV
jgi:hypothetical protein